ncbi:hypothetical protein [Streptomyces sp. CB03911]|uniref:hypothetical protein n=1 Tax=Streptomyces sp. CB03911 TaxID=1804758 RepID=UPI000938DB93|nr:hypothetical protein [Streptomyces sp. CB03911]OKI25051.1 hypothetical protein A6A07_31110 [Streptomyces sp. CB03911]
MNEFADLADPSAPDPPPEADLLVLELPATTSFDDGCARLEEAVKQDGLRRPWILVRVADEPEEVVTSREFLRENYGMSVPMTGGESGYLLPVGHTGATADVPVFVYRCQVAGCPQQQVKLYGMPPACPVHLTPMQEDSRP